MGQALRVVFWDQKHSETIHFRGIEKLDTRSFCAWLVECCVLIARSPLRHNWIVCLILVVVDSFCITSHFCNNRKGKTGHKWSLGFIFGKIHPFRHKKTCRDTVATPSPSTECPIQGRLLDWWKSTPGCHQGLNKLQLGSLSSLSNLRDLSSFVQRSQGLSYICEMSGALYIYPFFWIPFLQKHVVFLQVFAIQIHGLWSLWKNSHNCSDSWRILHDTVHVFLQFPFPISSRSHLTNCIGALHGRSIASCVASRTGRTGRTGIEPGDAALPSSFLLGLQLLIEIHLEISVRQRIPRLAKKATMSGVLHKTHKTASGRLQHNEWCSVW